MSKLSIFLTHKLIGVSHRIHYLLLKPATSAMFPRFINGTTVLLGLRLLPVAFGLDISLRPRASPDRGLAVWAQQLITCKTMASSLLSTPAGWLFKPVIPKPCFRLTWEVLKNSDSCSHHRPMNLCLWGRGQVSTGPTVRVENLF